MHSYYFDNIETEKRQGYLNYNYLLYYLIRIKLTP
jgi:hypothetical protein